MKNFKMDLNLLKKVINMNRHDLYDFLYEELKEIYPYVDTNLDKKNYLYCSGTEEQPVMLVAHLDTVFENDYLYGTFPTGNLAENKDSFLEQSFATEEREDLDIYIDKEQGVMWSPQGLGADDRVGVFMILSMVRSGLRPHILFTTDEEIGSLSGLEFSNIYKKVMQYLNIKYIIELDRAGDRDCVFYNCDNPKFIDYIESFGFEFALGSFTDICHICPAFGIAGVNLSVGYYNEHRETEMINLFTMSKNFDIIYKMVEKAKEIKETFVYIPKKMSRKREKVVDFSSKKKTEEIISEVCYSCGQDLENYLYEPNKGTICLDCFEKKRKKNGGV